MMAIWGCKDTLSNLQTKPVALGVMNEIVVVSDEDVWDSNVEDSVMFYFAGPYPIMPAPEPLFDIRHFSFGELNGDALRKELRTYIILADLSDSESSITKMVKNDLGEEAINKFYQDPAHFTTAGLDKWAKGQLIVYIMGKDREDLGRNVVRAFPRVSERIRKHDSEQLRAQTYVHGKSSKATNAIADKFGLQMQIPGDFQVAISSDNFIWVRKDTRDLTSSIAIRTYDYTNQDQLQKDNLIALRDRLGLKIEGTTVGSYMQTNPVDLPVYTYNIELDGKFTVESRGIWEMTDDFLGGPFVNYAVISGGKIYMIDTFVYAPGKDKRNYVQQLELVVSSLKFPS
jgi:hypothetical protein